MLIPNLLLIAGTGTKSGKTSMACKLIEQFREYNITAIKITPHFHETTPGLRTVCEEPGYIIYEETKSDTAKDTSRMLRAGAGKVYFAKVTDNQLLAVFNKLMGLIPEDIPIVCESPALRNYVDPGVLIIMTSGLIHNNKNISHLQSLPHVMYKLEKLNRINKIPIGFDNGGWDCRPPCPPKGGFVLDT
jgi:hypothetical protein